MPFLPEIPTWEREVINTQTFLGLNRGLSIGDGEMADMMNMSSDNYPVLSSRGYRGMPRKDGVAYAQTEYDGKLSGMMGTDHLIFCHEDKVYLDGEAVDIELSADPDMMPKKLVSMGANICIWPDKKYFNVMNITDKGDMGRIWKATEGQTITATMCRNDGTDYDMTQIVVSDTPPSAPENQDFWLDTSAEVSVLRQYSSNHQQWVTVATTFIKIQAAGIGESLKEGDAVWLTGVMAADDDGDTGEELNGTLTFSGVDVKLTSNVHTLFNYDGENFHVWQYSATEDTKTQTIKVKGLPKGAVVTKMELTYTIGKETITTEPGWTSQLTLNGKTIQPGPATRTFNLGTSNTDSVNVSFYYKSGAMSYGGNDTNSISITNVKLTVTYYRSASQTDAEQLNMLNTTNRVYACGDDYIVVAGLLKEAHNLVDTLTCELRVPDLDYVCESNNRIWGCSYTKKDGTILNEIHACALGDFRNWYKFQGTSVDSYTASVGSDGPFTAAFSLQGIPLFFKEGYLHRISGTMPSNYTLVTTECRGVQDGCWKSLSLVNETLYYKAPTDVMAYEGSLPYSVSAKLGTDRYYEAVGCNYQDKYYLCMRDAASQWHTFVLDTVKGMWHKEDKTKIAYMANVNGELILAYEGEEKTALRVAKGQDGETEEMEWSATFGILGFQSEQQKYLSRYNIRAQMSAGSHMKVEMQYDSDGKWHHIGTMRSPELRTFLLPIIPRRCDHCQLRLSGNGTVNIYSVAREYENGGDG